MILDEASSMESSTVAVEILESFHDIPNTTSFFNGSEDAWGAINGTSVVEQEREFIFDRLSVRVIFIALYTLVFCFCFFGNLMVILVVTLHWRMRNITKFCLANLAFADLCVGVFCVYQNLSTYLINSWVLGEFLCKMYQFINGLSHTASILIMVVMCVERYLAILHPFRCKQLLTINRLRLLMVAVWLASAIYCSPKLYYIVTLPVFRLDGSVEIICTAKRTLYDSRTFDMIHFFLLFLLPLLAITILYTRVGITLWKSSKTSRFVWSSNTSCRGKPGSSGDLSRSSSSSVTINEESSSSNNNGSRGTSVRGKRVRKSNRRRHGHCQGFGGKNELSPKFDSVFYKNCKNSMMTNGKPDSVSMVVTVEEKCQLLGPKDSRLIALDGLNNGAPSHHQFHHQHRQNHNVFFKEECTTRTNEPAELNGYNFKRKRVIKKLSRAKNLRGGREALKSRQTVVRMLIVIVVTFAVCNLPFHLRKMFQYWWPNYDYASIYSIMATPLTHLIMYANCAINPIIYAFMSKTFWSSFKEMVRCNWKKPLQSASGYREPSTQIIPLRSPRLNISRTEVRELDVTD